MAKKTYIIELVGDASSLEKSLSQSAAAAKTFEGQMRSVGQSTTKLGRSMTRNVTLPLAAAGVASVKTAQNFDLLISRMVGLGGTSAKQAKVFRAAILALAPKVGKGPAELAEGLYQIVSAGVKGKRALETLTVAAKGSAAGLGDTATVADALTSVMNAYAKSGMTAAKAGDILAATVRDGKGEASAFAPVLGKVVAVASQLGVGFDQVGGALAQMTKLGVPAEDAATQLSATFSALLKTTPAAEKALNAMGLSARGLREELREKGLLATLHTLAVHTKGSSTAMAEAFPNVRALRGILQLVGVSAAGTAKVFDDTKNSTNSLATAWRAYTNTDAAKMNKSLAQTKVAAIELGTALAPVADRLAHDLGRVADAFSKLSPHQKEVLIRFAELAAVAGPIVLFTGKVLTAAAAIRKLTIAAGEGGLLGAMTKLKTIGTITLVVELILNKDKIDSWMSKHHLGWANQGGLEILGDLFGGGGGKTGKFDSTAGSAFSGTATGAVAPSAPTSVVGFAKQFGAGSGITYTWGGVSPQTGFDCSGFLYSAYASAGIKIPRDTRSQWNDPNALDTSGSEKPGDGVYFTGSLSGANAGPPPGHVGIYIGGGKYIEYYSQGKPAKISRLGDRGDYMGARRWLKFKASTGAGKTKTGGGGATTAPAVSDYSTKTKTALAKAGFALPVTLQTAIAEANLTKGTADDIKALRAAEAWIKGKIGGMKGDTKLQALQALKGVEDDITGIEDAATSKRQAADKKAHDKQQAAWKKHMDKLRQIVEDKRSAFEAAFQAVAEKALQAFDRETQKGLAAIQAQFGAETPEEAKLRQFRADRDIEQRAKDRADAMSIEDPVERASRLRELDLQDQEDALQKAADASREARNQQLDQAQQSYEDDQDNKRTALEGWLSDQQTKLEEGKTQWGGFWDDLQKMAGIAGSDVGSAFWAGFNGTNAPASSALGGYKAAQEALKNPGGGARTASGTPTFSANSLLGFATGGVVPGTLGEPRLAVVHGGETISPPGGTGGVGSGSPVVVNVYGWVGNDQDIAKRVRNELTKIQRNGSKLGFQT
jgi:TP901 family phage tail tape measure protein